MAVHLVFERRVSRLVQAVELQLDPAPVREDQTVETDGQPGLIPMAHGLGRADGAGASGHEDPLPVGGVEGDGDESQNGTGELPRELGDQHAFQERSLVDALPAGRVGGPGDPGGIRVVGVGLVRGGGRCRSRDRRGFRWSGLLLAAGERIEGALVAGQRIADRRLGIRSGGLLRLAGDVRSGFPRRLPAAGSMSENDGTGPERAPPPLDVLQPEPLAQLEFRFGLKLGVASPLPISTSTRSTRGAGVSAQRGDSPSGDARRECVLLGPAFSSAPLRLLARQLLPLILGQTGQSVRHPPAAGDGFLSLGRTGRIRHPAAAPLIAEQHGSDHDGGQADRDLREEAPGDRAGRLGDHLLPKRRLRVHLRAPDPSG